MNADIADRFCESNILGSISGDPHRCAGNRDPAFLERLAHGFEHAPFELRQFIDRSQVDVAAEQSAVAGGMMR